jgi:hypothetical protein
MKLLQHASVGMVVLGTLFGGEGGALAQTALAGGTGTSAPSPAQQKYEQALQLLEAGNPKAALATLNAAVAEEPAYAEAYAARGNAQVALNRWNDAVADYAYSLSLSPTMASPLYGLGVSYRAQKEDWLASQYFQLYAESTSEGIPSDMRKRAADSAAELKPHGLRAALHRGAPECHMGTNKQQACGYNCRLGTNGVAACANTPDGACAISGDGHVACSQVAATAPTVAAAGVPTQRVLAIVPPAGANCRSSMDCGSGEFCKDRGDGVRVCMGHGIRGEPCKAAIDCDSMLMCKDRGDGFKVCM